MAGLSRRLAGLIAAAAVLLAGAALLSAARGRGVGGWITSPVVASAMVVAALSTVAVGQWVSLTSSRRIGRWITVLGVTVGTYLVLLAAAVWLVAVQGRTGTGATLLVVGALAGHVPVLTTFQLAALRVRDEFMSRSSARLTAFLVALAVANLVLGNLILMASDTEVPEPFSHLRALEVGAWFGSEVAMAVAGLLNWVWLLAILLGPILLWRAAARSSGPHRRRLAVAATASLVPVAQILLCGLLGVASVLGGMDPTVAVVLLLTGVSLAAPLTAVGYALSLRKRVARKVPGPALLNRAVAGIVAVLFAMVAVTISIRLGGLIGGDAAYAVALSTLAALGLLWPVKQRLLRWLLLNADPRRALAASLAAAPSTDPGSAAQAVIREASGDPAARLTLHVADEDMWIDLEDKDVRAPPAGSVTVRDSRGAKLGAVTFSRAPGWAGVDGMLDEVAPLVEKAGFAAVVRRQAARVAAEQARADQATKVARQALERDLHDGVQGRLVALALNLRLAQDTVEDPTARLLLDETVSDLRTSIEELRSLAAGAVADRLSRDGLAAAVHDLVGRMPVPIEVAITDERLPRDVEAAAYFVAAEAITNAVKHASAAAISVSVEHRDGALTVCVEDNGRGGADPRVGTGLRGMAERVEARGGRCLVSDRQPRGTRVEAVMPCGS